MESNTAQKKLKEIVKSYKQLWPDEYRAVCDIVKNKRKNNKDKFGSVRGGDAGKDHGMLERALFEISETLSVIIYKKLSSEEFAWHTSKEGGRWFQKTFKEFSLSELQ